MTLPLTSPPTIGIGSDDLVLLADCMAKQSVRRRLNKPVIPTVPLETWKALLAVADEFGRLAPWEWMHDSNLVGLRHPATGEILLGSILGRLRTIFALMVYRNKAGHRWVLETIRQEGDFNEFDRQDTGLEQDCIKAEFVSKRELEKEDRSILAACKYSPSKPRGPFWPQFRSFVPACFPWHITPAEADTLVFALPRMAAAARLYRDQPHAWDQHWHNETPFLPANFDPATDILRIQDLDWVPIISPPRPAPNPVVLGEAILERLKKLPLSKGFHLELDVSYASFSVAEADALNIPVKLDLELPALNLARETLQDYLSPGPH